MKPERINILPTIVWQSFAIAALAILLALGVNAMRADGIPLVADWSPAARLQATTGKTDLVVPMAQAIAFHDAREAVFVDARSPEEYAAGHIAGAINIPWEQVFDYLEQFFNAVPDNNTIVVVYCDGEGCPLSEELVLLMLDLGYENARILVNGWSLWKEHGYPVATLETKAQSS
jgi:3-mercaptopyruvate sulfurtransferase SseA